MSVCLSFVFFDSRPVPGIGRDLVRRLRSADRPPFDLLASDEEETSGRRVEEDEEEATESPKPIPPLAGALRTLRLRRISCLRDQLSTSCSFSFWCCLSVLLLAEDDEQVAIESPSAPFRDATLDL